RRREKAGALRALGPEEQRVVFGQAARLAKIDFAPLVQSGHDIDCLLGPGGQGGVFAIEPVAQEDVARFKLAVELAQQAQVMLVEAGGDDFKNRAAAQAKEQQKFEDRK